MRRTLRLSWLFVANSVSAQLEYRANFVAAVLSSVGDVLVGLLGLTLFFTNTDTLGGWTYPQAALVLGLFMLTEGVIATVLQPNLTRMVEQIRLGTMDFTLLKPVDGQFLVSARYINVFRVTDALVGFGVIAWALPQLEGVTLSGVALGALLYVSALVIVYSLWFTLATTSFWFVKVENVTELFRGLLSAGRFPAAAFPGFVRVFLTFVVPVAFVTTVPAQAVLGEVDVTLVLASPVVALLLFGLSRWFWLYALRSYTSASS